MFDIKIVDLEHEIIVGRHADLPVTMTEAFRNLNHCSTTINIDFWILKVFLGLWSGGLRLFIRSFRNRRLYHKLKNRECELHEVLHVFLDHDDLGMSNAMKQFIENGPNNIDLKNRQQVYLDMVRYISHNYGNIQIC